MRDLWPRATVTAANTNAGEKSGGSYSKRVTDAKTRDPRPLEAPVFAYARRSCKTLSIRKCAEGETFFNRHGRGHRLPSTSQHARRSCFRRRILWRLRSPGPVRHSAADARPEGATGLRAQTAYRFLLKTKTTFILMPEKNTSVAESFPVEMKPSCTKTSSRR